MIGITQNRIDDVKEIDLIAYLLDRYPDKFIQRKNGEQLVYKNYKSLVIYKDHAYDFGEVRHAYKDSIYVEQLLSGCTFMEAVERLEVWKRCKQSDCDTDNERLDLFDNLDNLETEAVRTENMMYIPDLLSE